MGFPAGPHYIDDAPVFTVDTHRFDTGGSADADSDPTYRIYENETGTPILTGTMAKLDDANTVGHYSEQITLSAANGFEVGKSYGVRVSATVNSVTGAQSFNFKVIATPPTAADVWAAGTRTLTALDEDSTTLDLNATIQAAVGLAAANLDTQLDAMPTANEIADALLDRANAVETSVTVRNLLRLVAATLGGKASGLNGTTAVYRNLGDTKDVVSATVDADGNRTAVTRDLT